MTLNGYFALNSVFAPFWLARTVRLSKNNSVKTNKDRPTYCQRHKSSAGTLVSGSIRFMRIFAEVPWGGGVKRQWGCRKRQFSAFSLAILSEILEARLPLL